MPKLQAFVDASMAPRAPYDVRGTAVVNRLDVAPLALAAGAVADTVAGTVSLSATFQGQASDPQSLSAFVNLQDVAVDAAGIPVRLERPARITASADDFSVDDLFLHVGTGLLTASGRLRDPVQAPLAVWYGGPVGDLVTMARAFGVAADVEATGQLNAWWESTGGLDNASSDRHPARRPRRVAGPAAGRGAGGRRQLRRDDRGGGFAAGDLAGRRDRGAAPASPAPCSRPGHQAVAGCRPAASTSR